MKALHLLCIGMLICIPSLAQIQKGSDILGSGSSEWSGYSVSMPDANHLAIGTPGYNIGSGQLKVYNWIDNIWIQKGININGEESNANLGWSVSMPDANTFCVGAPFYGNSEISSGYAQVFCWDGDVWVSKGINIVTDTVVNLFGWSVSMPDSNTVAIGAPGNFPYVNSEFGGSVRVYDWNGQAWLQRGLGMYGEGNDDYFGWAVSMPDPNTLAIGAMETGVNFGYVRIFSWDGFGWSPKGQDIVGELYGDGSGSSVSMPDSNTIAIGAYKNHENGYDAGHVRVFAWNGNAWIQKGLDIDGEAAGDQSGTSVSMPDINTLAVGANRNQGNGLGSGHVRLYIFDGSEWVQAGNDIDGEMAGDQLGRSVSMPDPFTVAVGAPLNDGNGDSSGQVKVFNNTFVGLDGVKLDQISAYPNPTNGWLTLELGSKFLNASIKIYGIDGMLLYSRIVIESGKLQIDLSNYHNGIYFLNFQSDMYIKVLKIIKS